MLLSLLTFAGPLVRIEAQDLPELTTAGSIRALSPEDAERGYPVKIRATVTLLEPDRTLFLQDATGGTFVRLKKGLAGDLASGMEVEVVGNTYPGLYLPGIAPSAVTQIGRGPQPVPAPVTFDELASGHRNYEWVSVSGIVRSVETGDDRTVLELSSGNGRLELHIPGNFDAGHLVDAVVDATGLAAGFINDKRQLVAPHLRMRSQDDLVVRTPAPINPYNSPIVPANQLLRFSPERRPGHRVRVTGAVTLHQPGRAVFIRDGEQGLQIGTRQMIDLHPGDRIEALGFPAIGRFSAMLQDASLSTTGDPVLLEPIPVTATELLNGAHDSDLVRVEAQLVRVLPAQDEAIFLMQSGSAFFQARLAVAESDQPLFRPGSLLELTGVCNVIEVERQPRGFRSVPKSYELLLRSNADVLITRAASWWTARKLGFLAASLFALACVAAAWAAILKYQIRRQTFLLSAKMQQEAITEERQRIAREFHDTLEQELIGLTLRLDALATRISEAQPRELLQGIRRLVHKLQVEVRMLVWDLRERAALRTDLAGSIREATDAVSRDRELSVTVVGDPVPISGVVQHHLVRIAQEAVTNAIKHGKARRIEIEIAFHQQTLTLQIRDAGTGFDVTSAMERPGHFGLLGMRERAVKAGATLNIESRAGEGARVTVLVPINSSNLAALPAGEFPLQTINETSPR